MPSPTRSLRSSRSSRPNRAKTANLTKQSIRAPPANLTKQSNRANLTNEQRKDEYYITMPSPTRSLRSSKQSNRAQIANLTHDQRKEERVAKEWERIFLNKDFRKQESKNLSNALKIGNTKRLESEIQTLKNNIMMKNERLDDLPNVNMMHTPLLLEIEAFGALLRRINGTTFSIDNEENRKTIIDATSDYNWAKRPASQKKLEALKEYHNYVMSQTREFIRAGKLKNHRKEPEPLQRHIIVKNLTVLPHIMNKIEKNHKKRQAIRTKLATQIKNQSNKLKNKENELARVKSQAGKVKEFERNVRIGFPAKEHWSGPFFFNA